MKVLFKFILLFLFLFLIGGSNKRTNIFFKSADIISIPIDDSVDCQSFSMYYYYDKKNDKELLFSRNKNRKPATIDVYDLQKKKLIKKIRLAGFKLDDFSLINLDTLIALNRKDDTLIFFNRYFKIFRIINLKSYLSKRIKFKTYHYPAEGYYEPCIFLVSPVLIQNNNLFIHIRLNAYPTDFFNGKLLLKINLITGENKLLINYPDKMRKGIDYGKYISSYLIKDNKILISFPVDHYLYLYDFDGNIIKKIYCKSKYLNKFAPYDSTQTFINGYSRKFEFKNGNYSSILYDKYRNLYYRVVRHNMKLKNGNRVNSYFDGKWSIIVMDSNFNILGEQVFAAKKYFYINILITKDGLLVSLSNPSNSDYDKNFYKYELFKINTKVK